MGPMEIDTHIDALARDGELFVASAARTGPDAPVPSCPEWKVRDLVGHLGGVHRWATTHVAERRTEMAPWVGDPGIADDELIEWFQDGHRTLVATLRGADPDLECFTFLPATSSVAFWARRQAHETAIHRVDAEQAVGIATAFDPAFAADGVDELVMAFAPTPRARVDASERRVLAVAATDAEGRWLIGLGPAGADARRGGGDADCEVSGPASDLYQLLWNRVRVEDTGVAVGGDTGLVDRWRDSLKV